MGRNRYGLGGREADKGNNKTKKEPSDVRTRGACSGFYPAKP